MALAELPTELLHAIAKGVDVEKDSSIFNLRLVSKRVNSVVSPLAFRVAVVNDSVKSAEAISFLQGCDESITSLVHEVIFRGDPENKQLPGNRISGEAGRKALKTVFSSLTKFPKLEILRLNFHGVYEEEVETTISRYMCPENPSHFLILQNQIFATLAANPPPPLVSLTLNNVIAVPDAIYAQKDFHRIFLPLQELKISVISDVYFEGSYYLPPLVEFWKNSVAHMVRSASAVTALTIRSDQEVGVHPALSFKGISLPRLASLVLHWFALEPNVPDSDIVKFILRHKSTITKLELHDCSIDGGEDGDFSRLWFAVLGLFEEELRALRSFVFENSKTQRNLDNTGRRDSRFEYTRLDPGWGYMPWRDEVVGEHQDLPALESLMAVVANRV